MFKYKSIRDKIVIWFAISLIIIVVFTFVLTSYVSRNIQLKNLQDTLVETSLHNMRGISYVTDLNSLSEGDQYLEVEGGYISIDEDFLDIVNGIYTSIYTDDHQMIYGEDPIARQSRVVDFSVSEIKTIKVQAETYYVFDMDIANAEGNALWMRGIVPESAGLSHASDLRSTAIWALPLMALLTIIGAYIIAEKSIKPIKEVAMAAERVGDSTSLKERVDLPGGQDEARVLAENFNRMLVRLDDAFERQKQFTSDASHELRTPTSVIMAQSEFYLEQERSKDQYIKALTVINKQANKMNKLINSMLDISRLEMKPENYPFEDLDLSRLVKSICDEMKILRTNDIKLSYRVEDGIGISGNRDLIQRVLVNLISNAYRYGKNGGYILVKLDLEDNHPVLRVQDNGIGIKEENLHKLFNRFFQEDTSRNDKGTGLGLSMVEEIVNMHGATIEVESVYGQGSEFIVRFE